jgi:hypothetical protein
VRGVGAVAPERDRVAVQGGQGSRDHADVQAAALPSGQDLGGEDVIGGAKARAERRGRKRDRRTHSWSGARVSQRGGRESRPGAGDGELARQRRALLLAGGVFDGSGAEERVQLRAMVSISGVLAEEKRQVAAPRFAAAGNRPTGESAVSASRDAPPRDSAEEKPVLRAAAPAGGSDPSLGCSRLAYSGP